VFGGFVFVVVFLPCLDAPCWGVVLLFCFVRFSLNLDAALPVVVGGFCLESLILAQDERWRRA
jgi:hypothetical protein